MVAAVVVAFAVEAVKVNPQSVATSPITPITAVQRNDAFDPTGPVVFSGNPFLTATQIQSDSTSYDAQRWDNGVRVAVDSKGNVHFAYMYYPLTGGSYTSRTVKYNMWDKAENKWAYNQSIQVSGAKRAGYCTIGVLSDDRPVVAYHESTISATDTITSSVVAVEVSPGLGVFSYTNLPIDPTRQEIWPNVIVGSDDVIHVVSTNSEVGTTWDGSDVYYSRSTDDGKNFSAWFTIQKDKSIRDASLAVSPNGKKVAVLWPRGFTSGTSDTMYINFCNYLYRESTDGGKTWGTTKVITEDRYPQAPVIDEFFRLWGVYYGASLAGIYDDQNNLHAVFGEGFINTPSATSYSWIPRACMRLVHWSSATGEFNAGVSGKLTQIKADGSGTPWEPDIDSLHYWGVVAYPDDGNPYFYAGTAFPTFARADKNLICVWQGQWDTLDVSAAYYTNMDVNVAISDDYGVTWKPVVDWDSAAVENDSTRMYFSNITNTHSELAAPGYCEDESCVSVYPIVGTDNLLQITYIKDLFSGNFIYCDATQTNNPVMYLNQTIKVGKKTDEIAVEETPQPQVSDITLMGGGPYSNAVTFKVGNPSANSNLKIYNVSGSLVETIVSGAETITWDAGTAPAGVYFYSFSTSTNTSNGRFVVVH